MRVLFTTTNWKGVYFCMVPLGWALQAAGHDVRVTCAPSETDAVSRAGLIPVPVMEDIDLMRLERIARYAEVARSPDRLGGVPLIHPDTGRPVADVAEYDVATHEPAFRKLCAEANGRNFDAAVSFARAWRPSLVVHDLMAPDGVLAAAVIGVPSVYHSPGMFGAAEASLHDPTGAFERHGVELDRSLIAYTIDPTPSAVLPDHASATRIPVRYVPYNGPGEMPTWVLDRPTRPRVCMTWGRGTSNIFGTGVPALRYAVDAVLSAGAELVLTAPRTLADGLPELPEGVRLLRDFPVHMLLPTCDAVIHQGSVNLLMVSAAAGLPQLTLGFTDDGTEMGRRFTAGGSSRLVHGMSASPEQVRDAVTAVLDDPSLRDAAKRIQADMSAQPSVADLVAPLERLAHTGKLAAADLGAPDK